MLRQLDRARQTSAMSHTRRMRLHRARFVADMKVLYPISHLRGVFAIRSPFQMIIRHAFFLRFETVSPTLTSALSHEWLQFLSCPCPACGEALGSLHLQGDMNCGQLGSPLRLGCEGAGLVLVQVLESDKHALDRRAHMI